MATTAYERYLKNKKEEDALEAVDIQVQDSKPIDLDEIKFKIQKTLTEKTEPQKPVKWLSLPDPKNIMNLYYTLNPTKRLGDAIGMKKDPPRARLPKEITDDIVQLMANSAEALEDFASISTQQDVDQFNKKYNVNLVLPAEA